MMYESAVLMLKDTAKGRYSSVSFNTDIYSDGTIKSKVRLYIAGPAGEAGWWTADHTSFTSAFTELERHLADELPEFADEAPAGDQL